MVQIGDFSFPEDRFYNKDHVWIQVEDEVEQIATLGIDAMGYSIAGTISVIRIKKPSGKPQEKGRAFGTMESGKGVVPLKSPLNCTILEVNPLLDAKDYSAFALAPFDNWLVRVEYADSNELGSFLKDTGEISKWAKEELAKMKK
jgi:glycine cleavage system H lipoate-binding protein